MNVLCPTNDADFYQNVVHTIDGWLEEVTARLTMCLIAAQRERGILGGFFEIGVYKGKFFSILLREAIRDNSKAVGVDTFQFVDRAAVLEVLHNAGFHDLNNMVLLQSKSTDMTPEYAMDLLGGRAQFVSVDGSHEAVDVEFDIGLSDGILGNGGIIAIDDFINPMTLGVNEGTNKFFLSHGAEALTPFCYCVNKLFLCRPQMHRVFSEAVETFVRNHQEFPQNRLFLEHEATWRGMVEVAYFGTKLLIIH